jgi:hypothetical protein
MRQAARKSEAGLSAGVGDIAQDFTVENEVACAHATAGCGFLRKTIDHAIASKALLGVEAVIADLRLPRAENEVADIAVDGRTFS